MVCDRKTTVKTVITLVCAGKRRNGLKMKANEKYVSRISQVIDKKSGAAAVAQSSVSAIDTLITKMEILSEKATKYQLSITLELEVS